MNSVYIWSISFEITAFLKQQLPRNVGFLAPNCEDRSCSIQFLLKTMTTIINILKPAI